MEGLDFIKKSMILVVDDTSDNLILMNSLLKDDYKVKIANSGDKALKIAASDLPPDLILLDIMMPGMDGYEVCRRLKHDPKTRNIPVIFLTAKSEMEDEKKGLELGAVDYLIKPISPPIVMARVRNHLALKTMADVLQEKNVELSIAKTVAEKVNLAKSEFLSGMSHELRSPLNAILGFAQLMESDSPPPSPIQQESINQILQAGWHLLTLINEILDLAKIESGKLALSPEPLSVGEVMLECQTMLESQAEKHGIRITFPLFDLPCFVQADRTRLKQVLINLLSNAIKYNKVRGTVVVDCFKSAPERIRISVKDTGEGLAPEKLAQLFQPFNRLGQESGAEEGTGIGLVLAKQLIEMMGGLIGVESTVGVGSVFWIELIAAKEPKPADEEAEPIPIACPQLLEGERLRVLLYVEDNPANLKLVDQLIARRPDLRLVTAINGHLGIEMARTSKPEMILMDINLPDITGIEVLKILRKDPTTAHIPVVALSANAMPGDIENGLAAGFFRYLTKPIKVNEFMDTLQVALEFAETLEQPVQIRKE